ncbi:uncharacterized protein TrAFT101_000357 [Trichoderma asperellum]|uniref:uncharacterized protein n=1 Tax=Trichoderma asperellum TaxID=101201 RepID=UPI00333390C3|nr:hypothetical protein TrAFT101_000357 [Trichoderma asperellum]
MRVVHLRHQASVAFNLEYLQPVRFSAKQEPGFFAANGIKALLNKVEPSPRLKSTTNNQHAEQPNPSMSVHCTNRQKKHEKTTPWKMEKSQAGRLCRYFLGALR